MKVCITNIYELRCHKAAGFESYLFITHTLDTLHIVRNLYFQRGSLRLTGSLSVRAEGLLKVKVRDSVGAKAY